jgi:aryl-alcohol dehydrogenase-like predicted oxidoreductase
MNNYDRAQSHAPGEKISRREFTSMLLGAGALVGFSKSASGPALASASHELLAADSPAIELRKFGNMGPKISGLSFSCSELSKSGWEPLGRALRAGVNYVDTSPAFEKSEDLVGENLLGAREKIMISTRWLTDGTESADTFLRAFENSRQKLRTHCINVVMLQNIVSITQLKCIGVREAFSSLKKDNKVKFMGLMTKSNQKEVLESALMLGGFEIALVAFNLSNFRELDAIIEKVGRQGMGVIVMDTVECSLREPALARRLLGKKKKSVAAATIAWALGYKWISSVLVPMKTIAEVDEYANAAIEEE